MTTTIARMTALLVACVAAAGAFAEVVGVAYERNVDQEVVTVLPVRGAPSIVLQRRFLEPRKARVDPQRAATDTLQVLDQASGKASSVLSYKADAPLWIGPAVPLADGVAFSLRTGTDAAAVYKVLHADRSVRRVQLPWDRKGAEGRVPDYERLFLLTDGVIGVRSEVGVHQAELWLGDSGTSAKLDTFVQNGDGRVISIDDVAEVDGRVLLLMMVAAGEGKAEVWLLAFDRSFQRANARAMRLETGTLASGKVQFVRSGQGAVAVRVTQRTSTYGRPTIKLFPLTGGTPLWSHELPRVLGADEVAITGVCRRSFLVVRSSEEERLRNTDVEWLLLGPAGQETVMDRVKMPEATSVMRSMAVTDRDKVWSYINFSRLEPTRRADGWYGWRGFQSSVEAMERYCKFE